LCVFPVLLCLSVLTVQGQSLTSSEPEVKKFGESVTLSCAVSGISMGSYWMHWIRQKPGKGLEWIGYGNCKYSLKSRFSISKDDSNNIVILEGQRSQTEDTAVYYCARYNDTQWCDGKHDLYENNKYVCLMKPSEEELFHHYISHNRYLMCMIEDFTPNKVTVTWKKNDMEVKGQTTTVGKQPSGLYSGSSLLKVTNTDWNNKVKYSCVVQYQEQTPIKTTISKTGLYIGEDCTTIDVMHTYRISIV
uniref:Ig-like domain-containing protein n=1 Tax=Hucho hucho TaxID=62062 RepID=A0A4W5JMB8_9TELE